MQASELKFLLKLLGHPNYRASITQLKPNNKTSAPERDRICRDLAKREYISYTREIRKFRIESAGKNLLKQKDLALPLTEHQFEVLEACRETVATPGSVKKVPATERQAVIQDLETKGFIKVAQEQIKDVELTARGHEYLRSEYSPGGSTTINLTLEQLGNYLTFLRKSTQSVPVSESDITPTGSDLHPNSTSKPSDDEVLGIIKTLDRELGSANYLPIFHLRQKLQPPLHREELDQALYRLQKQDKVELSSLQEGAQYTEEQIDMGIPQLVGGPLFYIVTTEEFTF